MKTLILLLAITLLSTAAAQADRHVISYDSLKRDQEAARERQSRPPTADERRAAEYQEMQHQIDRQNAEIQQQNMEMQRMQNQERQRQIQQQNNYNNRY